MRALIPLILLGAAGLASCAAEPQPVLRVFLLAGQSNMEGHAVADLNDPADYNGGRGNLVHLLADPVAGARWQALRARDGRWAVRDDVFISYKTEERQKAGPLTVGFAVYDDAHHFGPELALGAVLGERFAEPVLLIKTAWGGKSLAADFRPPGAGGATGPCYVQMLEEFRTAMAAVPTAFPQLAHHAPRIEGVFWFQGWNDGCDDAAAAEYEANLKHLITDLRAELGDPSLPFVAGETGNMDNMILRAAQQAGCEQAAGGGARFVPTASFLRQPEDSPNPTHQHHWFGNAESYLLIGDGLGRAMVELLDNRGQ